MSDQTDTGILRRWRTRGERRALTAQSASPLVSGSGGSDPFYSPYTSVGSPDQAMRIADVFACVRLLSDTAASIPLVAYRRTTDGRERYTGRVSDLLTRPAPGYTQANLIGQIAAHLALYGNAYIGKFRDSAGRVEQLALLHPERVAPELKNGRLIFTVTGGAGEQTVVGTEDVIPVRALGTDGISGLSPIRQCQMALGLAEGMGEFANAFVRNGARPSGMLVLKGAHVSANQQSGMKQVIDANWKGVRNAHKVAVITGDVEWQPLGIPADDLQFVEQRHLSTAEVARIFRVPPWMIGASAGDSLTYSNTEQQSLSFVMWSVRPMLVAIEQAITADEDLSPSKVYVEFLIDSVLRADSKTRADVYALALDPERGWMNRDEVRRLENLPVEGAPAETDVGSPSDESPELPAGEGEQRAQIVHAVPVPAVENVEVHINVPEQEAPTVNVDAPVTVNVPATEPRSLRVKRDLQGRIESIEPVMTTVTQGAP
jgi:HK97 family phage portal protein